MRYDLNPEVKCPSTSLDKLNVVQATKVGLHVMHTPFMLQLLSVRLGDTLIIDIKRVTLFI